MPPKQKKPVLDRIADEERYTKDEARELASDLETQSATAEALSERLDNLTEIELEDLAGALDGFEDFRDFDGIGEHIEALKVAKETAESIQTHLGTFTDNVPEFAEAIGTWADGEDAEERRDAKSEMPGYADNIRQAKTELLELGVDIEQEL